MLGIHYVNCILNTYITFYWFLNIFFFRDSLSAFMERQGAPKPGVLTLTSGLSLPFRRLEKYPSILAELHCHIEENHQDRGDTQRSISVFRDLVVWSTFFLLVHSSTLLLLRPDCTKSIYETSLVNIWISNDWTMP